MIFFKNLFFLLLSVALFAQGGTTTSQNITATDSPSELIDGKLATYKSPKTQNFHDAEGLMHSTIESIYSTIPIPTFCYFNCDLCDSQINSTLFFHWNYTLFWIYYL